jgi:hypothetical protein
MATDVSELSSISSSLEQLSRRIASLGESAQRSKQEDVAAELFAVERAIASAERRLTRLVERSR